MAMDSRRRQVSWAAAAACSRAAHRQSYKLPRLQYSARAVMREGRSRGSDGHTTYVGMGTPPVYSVVVGIQAALWRTCDDGRGQRHQPHELHDAAGRMKNGCNVSALQFDEVLPAAPPSQRALTWGAACGSSPLPLLAARPLLSPAAPAARG